MSNTIDHPHVIESHGGGACPEQHFGELIDGRIFYFRFRSNCAQLHVGTQGEILPSINPEFDMDEFNKTLAPGYSGPFYPVNLWRRPLGTYNAFYENDPLIGFFQTDEDRNNCFTHCLNQIYEADNATTC